jgi:hypothetical protein
VGARRCEGLHVRRGASKEQEFTAAHAPEHSEPNVPCTLTPHTHTHQTEETGRGKNVRREGKKNPLRKTYRAKKRRRQGRANNTNQKKKKKVKKHKKKEPSHWASLWADPRPPSVDFSSGLVWERVGLCGVPHKHTQKKRRNRKNKKKKNTKKLWSKGLVEDRIRREGRK